MRRIKLREDYTQELMSGIKALETRIVDDEHLRTELRAQSWMVEAVRNTTVGQSVKAAATYLHNLIGREASGSEIRSATTSLIAEWSRSRSEVQLRPSGTASLAWWSSLSAVCSTIFAILLGTQGIIPLIDRVSGQSGGASSREAELAVFNQFEFTVYLLHVMIISLFILFRFTQFGSSLAPRQEAKSSDELSQAAELTLREFTNGWTFIWITWLLLYVWFAGTQAILHAGYSLSVVAIWALGDVLNLTNAIAFFYCYLTLDMPHLKKSREEKRNEKFRRTFVGLVIVCIVVACLSVLDRLEIIGFGGGANTLLSFVVAVSMAYFFARLDSHYLGVRRWMLAPMYLYVAIQVTWSNFGSSAGSSYQAIIFCLALGLKVYLYVAVMYWIQSGALGRYIRRACEKYPDYEVSWGIGRESRNV